MFACFGCFNFFSVGEMRNFSQHTKKKHFKTWKELKSVALNFPKGNSKEEAVDFLMFSIKYTLKITFFGGAGSHSPSFLSNYFHLQTVV